MKPLTGGLSHTDVACADRNYCSCLFLLWRDGKVIAACSTYEAHNAARSLLGEKP